VPRLWLETDPPDTAPADFGGPTDVLVYFLSLAFSTRYGSQHPISQLSLLLRRERKIDFEPLGRFADRNVEEEADAREIERAWQPAARLACTLRAVVEALDSGDERIELLTAESPDLRPRLRDLLRMVEAAAASDARVRMTYEL
jgi:hypothetical protein